MGDFKILLPDMLQTEMIAHAELRQHHDQQALTQYGADHNDAGTAQKTHPWAAADGNGNHLGSQELCYNPSPAADTTRYTTTRSSSTATMAASSASSDTPATNPAVGDDVTITATAAAGSLLIIPRQDSHGGPLPEEDGRGLIAAAVLKLPAISRPLKEKDMIGRAAFPVSESSSSRPVMKREPSEELIILPEMVQCPLSIAFSMAAGVANSSARLQSPSAGMSGNQQQPSGPPPLRGCQRLLQFAPLPTGANQRRPLPLIPAAANMNDPSLLPSHFLNPDINN